MGHSFDGFPTDCGVGGDNAIHAVALKGGRNHRHLRFVKIGGDLDEDGNPAGLCCAPAIGLAVLFGQGFTALGNGAQQAVECCVTLQCAQVLRVWRTDIHRDVVRVRIHALQTGQVIAGGVFDGCAGVFSNIQSEQHGVLARERAKACLLHVVEKCVQAIVVEAQTVDQCPCLG